MNILMSLLISCLNLLEAPLRTLPQCPSDDCRSGTLTTAAVVT